VSRFPSSRKHLVLGGVALAITIGCTAWAVHWPLAAIPAGLFLGAALLFAYLGTRPAIVIYESHLAIGKERIAWNLIKRVDRTGWVSPLIMILEFEGGERRMLIHAGTVTTSKRLTQQLFRHAREASIDGLPYNEFWRIPVVNGPKAGKMNKPAKYPLLTPEDEAEVEEMFRRLKTVGHLDPISSPDEK